VLPVSPVSSWPLRRCRPICSARPYARTDLLHVTFFTLACYERWRMGC
jgi:hypothetical protein